MLGNITRRLKKTPRIKARPKSLKPKNAKLPSTKSIQAQATALIGNVANQAGSALRSQRRILDGQARIQTRQAIMTTKHFVGAAEQVASAVSNSADQISEEALDFLATLPTRNRLLDAVKHAVEMWRLQAHFRDLKIMAISAIGTPGCLSGPSLAPLIESAPGVAGLSGLERELVSAVADGVDTCFGEWQDFVTVPGLPWYPAFAAFPGAMAPPMPNVPTPLLSCISGKVAEITTPTALAREIKESLPDALQVDAIERVVDSVAACLAASFLAWLAAAQVMMVMGKGPVPTFAPPFVPIGPVMNGDIIEAPGHLSSGPFIVVRLPF